MGCSVRRRALARGNVPTPASWRLSPAATRRSHSSWPLLAGADAASRRRRAGQPGSRRGPAGPTTGSTSRNSQVASGRTCHAEESPYPRIPAAPFSRLSGALSSFGYRRLVRFTPGRRCRPSCRTRGFCGCSSTRSASRAGSSSASQSLGARPPAPFLRGVCTRGRRCSYLKSPATRAAAARESRQQGKGPHRSNEANLVSPAPDSDRV
jgi:hypothetical protein